VTDWKKTSGSSGTMTIRDTGDIVEFYFKAGDDSDWANGLDFNWTANGGTTSHSLDYPTGSPNVHVGSVNIGSSQTVTFRLTSDTSISGIGGPTSFSHAISRDTVPAKPSTPKASGITATTMVITFSDGANGGDAIDSRQITYGTDPDGGTHNVSSDRSTTISGLTPGTRYYFWARTHNSQGFSAWSGRSSYVTLKVPDAPTIPLLSSVTATSVDASWSANGSGGATITGYRLGYATDPHAVAPTTVVSARSPQTITGLIPGTTYYIRAQVQNAVGWGPWSKAAAVSTVAGAYILVGTVWKLAVPYVRVGGVWKIAEPWTRSVGVWARTI
jgi:Fibronectin type III domain